MGTGKGSGWNDFNISGPNHLSHVDWKSPDHRRIVAACLVKGVYVLERDRQKMRKGAPPLAQPWFRSFRFRLYKELFDPRDKSIFGAIYRFESPSHLLPSEAPEYLIAFRGTMLKKKSCSQDLKLDCAILHQYFHRTERSKSAKDEVESVVKDNPKPKVWLAGHSLGSALAVQAGKNAAKKAVFLETFLFNPPFPRVKQWISNAKGKVTAKLVTLFKGRHHLSEGSLVELCTTTANWNPYLFVNKHDCICSGYIKYFKQRQKMTTNQARATMYSVRALFKNWIKAKICRKNNKNHYQPFYLLPTASLIINTDKTRCHEIAQWWRPNLQLEPATSYPCNFCWGPDLQLEPATSYPCTFCPLLDVLGEITM